MRTRIAITAAVAVATIAFAHAAAGQKLLGNYPSLTTAAALQAAQAAVTRDIAARAAAQGITGPQVGKLIHQARVDAVAHWLREAAAE